MHLQVAGSRRGHDAGAQRPVDLGITEPHLPEEKSREIRPPANQ
jgi:hypothetical protein